MSKGRRSQRARARKEIGRRIEQKVEEWGVRLLVEHRREEPDGAKWQEPGVATMVAERLGVHVKTLQRWMSGETMPDADDLQRMLEVFGVSPLWIVAGAGAEELGRTRSRMELAYELRKFVVDFVTFDQSERFTLFARALVDGHVELLQKVCEEQRAAVTRTYELLAERDLHIEPQLAKIRRLARHLPVLAVGNESMRAASLRAAGDDIVKQLDACEDVLAHDEMPRKSRPSDFRQALVRAAERDGVRVKPARLPG